MKKNLPFIVLALALTGAVTGYAQNERKIIYPCNTDEMMEDHFKRNPSARKQYEEQQKAFRAELEATNNNKSKTAVAVQYTVPVVFHVLHQGGSENIPDQKMIDAIQWVNDDLAKAHSDATLTAAPFSSLYINSDIKLMLAHKDPNGNCTNGIVRHVDAKTNWSQAQAQPSDAYWAYTWDPKKYLNIYIVADIIPQGNVTGGGIIVGYTYRPGTWPAGNPHDAIIYNCNFLDGSESRSLTHEVGHWFNLSHTWGNTNDPGVSCGDDGIADTPDTKGNFNTCPSSISGNTCHASGTDNIQNIMNYASCPINFTQGQTNAMRTALGSTISARNSVTSASNHIATDINGTGICAPISDFLSTSKSYTICSGGILNMQSTSYNGTVSTYAWAADNGATCSNPTGALTNVTFPNTGTVLVTLTVTNGQGSSASTRTVYVRNGAAGVPNNYMESFEEAMLPPTNWDIVNGNPGSITWADTELGASHGAKSYYINGPASPPDQIDYLVMPILNPQALPDNTIFTFKYAYARYSATHNDKFEVQASKDCGGTWSTVLDISALNMANASAGVDAVPFTPQPNHWVTVDVYNHPNWFQFTGYPSVQVRFMFREDPTAGFGNRMFLDEINFADPNGVNELTKSIGFRMYPNPTKSQAEIKLSLNDAATVSVEVVDIVGKKVIPAEQFNFGPGEQTITVNKNGSLGKGMYFVNLTHNGAKMSSKLIIE